MQEFIEDLEKKYGKSLLRTLWYIEWFLYDLLSYHNVHYLEYLSCIPSSCLFLYAHSKKRLPFKKEQEALRRLRVDELNPSPCLRKIDANMKGVLEVSWGNCF